jgi:tRNA(fMet)-specific endonuclease VapC
MNYLLDTNICVHFFRGKYNLLKKFEKVGIENCAISEITLAELFYGAEKSQNPSKNHKLIEDFVQQIAVLPLYSAIYMYGKEKARLSALGTKIGDFDLLIGSTAVENELIMVTENISEFERISNIKIENWIERK